LPLPTTRLPTAAPKLGVPRHYNLA
jgi:hypothetical protein